MIFYFSGTGNSKWVAEKMAEKLNDTAVSIVNAKENSYTFNKGERAGLVFPVYAWGPPAIVIEFAKKLRINGAFVFGVCTCASETGYTMKKLSKVLSPNSVYSIIMPSNYIIASGAQSDESIKQKISNAQVRINKICDEIIKGISKTDITMGKLPFIKSSLIGTMFDKFGRTTKAFYAKENCNSCGLCEKQCPNNTIHLENGKPVWGKECSQCLSCINRCPKEAIEYGKSTIGRKRYYFKYD